MVSLAQTGYRAGRLLKALAVSGGNWDHAAHYEAGRGGPLSSEVADICSKASVAAMDTVALASILASVNQDLAMIAPKLGVVSRLMPLMRLVPANTPCISGAPGAVAFWAGGEGGAAAVSSLSFVRASLMPQRLNALSVITKELSRSADPKAELVIANDHARAKNERRDSSFLDPANAGSPEVLPRSITYDSQKFASSGSAVSNIDNDLRLLLGALSDAGSDLQNATFVLNPRTAAYIAALRGSGGSPCYPRMSVKGGELLGASALVSASVARTGSPQETYIALLDPTMIWLCDEGSTFRISADVTLEMTNNPTNNSVTPSASSQVSMFQTDTIACLSTTYTNWRAVTTGSAATVLTGVSY